MGDMIDKAGLQVASELVRFIEDKALPGTGIEAGAFWTGVAAVSGVSGAAAARDCGGSASNRGRVGWVGIAAIMANHRPDQVDGSPGWAAASPWRAGVASAYGAVRMVRHPQWRCGVPHATLLYS